MKISDYVKATITEDGFGFSVVSESEELECYLSDIKYDRSSYDFKMARIILIYDANLKKVTKEAIHKAFEKILSVE